MGLMPPHRGGIRAWGQPREVESGYGGSLGRWSQGMGADALSVPTGYTALQRTICSISVRRVSDKKDSE